jgi:hypothetical protein
LRYRLECLTTAKIIRIRNAEKDGSEGIPVFLIKNSSFHGLKIRNAGRQEKMGAKHSCIPAFLI